MAYDETLVIGNRRIDLACNPYPGVIFPRGDLLLKSSAPPRSRRSSTKVDGSSHEVCGENTTVIEYAWTGGRAARGVAADHYHVTAHENGAIYRDVGLLKKDPRAEQQAARTSSAEGADDGVGPHAIGKLPRILILDRARHLVNDTGAHDQDPLIKTPGFSCMTATSPCKTGQPPKRPMVCTMLGVRNWPMRRLQRCRRISTACSRKSVGSRLRRSDSSARYCCSGWPRWIGCSCPLARPPTFCGYPRLREQCV
jgi:hypothetical protein